MTTIVINMTNEWRMNKTLMSTLRPPATERRPQGGVKWEEGWRNVAFTISHLESLMDTFDYFVKLWLLRTGRKKVKEAYPFDFSYTHTNVTNGYRRSTNGSGNLNGANREMWPSLSRLNDVRGSLLPVIARESLSERLLVVSLWSVQC